MYCHPRAVKKWIKSMKPQATPQQIEQAKIMRAALIIFLNGRGFMPLLGLLARI